MVGHVMKRAFRKLEARKTRERREVADRAALQVIDPSHELSQQRQDSTISLECQPCLHTMGLQSNPELHTSPTVWSSSVSVCSFDGSSELSLLTDPISPYPLDIDDDMDMMLYDQHVRAFPMRRRSTGCSRAKSQQKLARILGWNTSFPQWKPSGSSQGSESLVSMAAGLTSPLKQKSPTVWEESVVIESQTSDTMPDLKMRQYPTRASDSKRSATSKSESQPYDFQMRQFLTAHPYKDKESAHRRQKLDIDTSHRVTSPRDSISTPRTLSPNVHKPLPNTPSLPTFATVQPLQQQTPTRTSTTTSNIISFDDFTPMLELSAEEAHILLSHPEPTELSTESSSGRAELADDSPIPPNSRSRSKSPTNQPRNSCTVPQVHDFGPGTTLSVIEEEPFDAEDLARFKVYELPAEDASATVRKQRIMSKDIVSSDTCPGLSPSSSLSSRRLQVMEEETEAQLEYDVVSAIESDSSDSSIQRSVTDGLSSTSPEETDLEGEEIIVIYDRRSDVPTINMNGKSFLALDIDEDEEEESNSAETEGGEIHRNSIQSESRFTSTTDEFNPGFLSAAFEERLSRRSTGADTTKTTSTTKTLVGDCIPDYSGDLAKQMDWL